MKRLDRLARAVEAGRDPFADVDKTIARERRLAPEYGGCIACGSARRTSPG